VALWRRDLARRDARESIDKFNEEWVMGVIVTFEAKAKPGQGKVLRETFLAILPDTRAYKGCQALEYVQNQDDPDALLVWERWDARASYEAYLKWRQDRGDVEKLVALLAGPPNIRFFDTVSTY
jgi:quinol monooxygenase YgiN